MIGATMDEQLKFLQENAGSALVGDVFERLGGATGFTRYDATGRCVVGTALTVQTRPGDNLAIFAALEKGRPGDILVVEGGGCTERALVGDLARSYAIQRGVLGFIVDGAVRDVAIFRDGTDFACFARGASHRGPFKDGPGRVGVPVAIGQQVIASGDIVIADDDGIISFAQSSLDEVRAQVGDRLAAEERIRSEIMTGRVEQSWMESAMAEAGGRIR